MKLKAISRVNEYIDPELLEDHEVTVLKNMTLDGGIPKKRGAVQSYNTNSAGGSISQLFELGGTLYGRVGTTVKKLSAISAAGTWSSPKTGLTDTNLQFERYNDKGYFSNGTDDLFVIDNSTAYNFIIEKPDVSGVTTSTASADGDMATGKYKYRLAYYTADGVLSNISDIFEITISTDSIQLDDLPVSADGRVNQKRLYRTQVNSDTFYLHSTLGNSTADFEDTLGDVDLISSGESINFLMEVEYAKAMCLHKNRLVLGYVKTGDATDYGKWDLSVSSESGGLTGTYAYGISFTMSDGTETELVYTERIVLSSQKAIITYRNLTGEAKNVSQVNLYRGAIGGSWNYQLINSYSDLTKVIEDDGLSVGSNYPAINAVAYTGLEYKHRVYYSDIEKLQQIPELNYVDVYPDDDQEIIGLVDQEDGILVFKEKSICMIYTSGSPYNWRIVKLIDNVGCSDVDTIQRAKNSIYFKFNNDIYRYPDLKVVSLEFQPTLDGIDIEDTTYVSKYNWYVVIASNDIYIYDERYETWLHFSPSSSQFESAIETVDGDFFIGYEVLMRYESGETLDYDSAEEADTSTISTTIRSKTFALPPPQGFRFRKIYSNFQKGSSSVTQSITDPQNSISRTKAETNTGWIDYRGILDAWTGSMEMAHKFYYQISGDLTEFNGMEITGIVRTRDRTWS